MRQEPEESASPQEPAGPPEAHERQEPPVRDEADRDEPAGRWIEAALIAAFVALAPVRIVGKLTDLDIPLWAHGVLFVLFTVVVEQVLRGQRKPDTD
jgi:hypothetical protein